MTWAQHTKGENSSDTNHIWKIRFNIHLSTVDVNFNDINFGTIFVYNGQGEVSDSIQVDVDEV